MKKLLAVIIIATICLTSYFLFKTDPKLAEQRRNFQILLPYGQDKKVKQKQKIQKEEVKDRLAKEISLTEDNHFAENYSHSKEGIFVDYALKSADEILKVPKYNVEKQDTKDKTKENTDNEIKQKMLDALEAKLNDSSSKEDK